MVMALAISKVSTLQVATSARANSPDPTRSPRGDRLAYLRRA
jgi:hypothetical protein